MRSGFSLVEVVVALVVLEIAAVGVAGILQLASSTLGRAEELESAVANAEGVLDSLKQAAILEAGTQSFDGGDVVWTVSDERRVVVRAVTDQGVTLFVAQTILPAR
jgi:type II secretory pathway pseudopilin PulG